jgi:hypothetical protein
MSIVGAVLPVLSIGLGSIRVRPTRGFYPTQGSAVGPMQPLIAQATIEELHRDDIEITDHPVELGAPVSDHAFKRPAEVIIHCGWSDSPSTNSGLIGAAVGLASARFPIVGAAVAAAKTVSAVGSLLSGNSPSQARAIYQQLLELQASRIPFNVYTGKRAYKNMLFKTLSVTTDKRSDNSLMVTAVCREVIIVSTQVVQLPINASAVANPQATLPTIKYGMKQLQTLPSLPNIPGLS